MNPLSSFLLVFVTVTSITLYSSLNASLYSNKLKSISFDKHTNCFTRNTEHQKGCAGIESAKRGSKYSCDGYLTVKAKNMCNRKMQIKICIEVMQKNGRRFYDCGSANVKAGGTTTNSSCNATGKYYTEALEPY
jgi:hypothetical protein